MYLPNTSQNRLKKILGVILEWKGEKENIRVPWERLSGYVSHWPCIILGSWDSFHEWRQWPVGLISCGVVCWYVRICIA